MRREALVGSLLLFAAIAQARAAAPPVQQAPAPAALLAEIHALKPARVVWREVAWKSCLLEGLKESRAKSKPILLWVFIDRPTDDARC